MKRAIPIVILLAVAVAAGVYYYPRLTQKSAPANQVTLSGNIEAHESLVGFKVAGRIVELPVEEGQQVEQGALLARLDDADYRQKVRIDQSAVGVRSSDLALTLAGTRQQEVKAAQQTMIDAQADRDEKNLDYERARQLFAKDELSAQDRDLAATALKRAQAVFQAAEQRYNEAVEGSRKEDIAIARANLNAAHADLGLSQVNLGYTVLRAPSAGVVTVRQAELGEVVSPGSPVVTLADLDHIWLRAYIAETDLGRIHWGQAATITTDTYPGRQYHGRISFISSSAEFTPKSVQTYKERVTLVYRIKIDIDNFNHELKPGMPADARIDLAANEPAAQTSGAASAGTGAAPAGK
jgi:HlyD family secretion protein